MKPRARNYKGEDMTKQEIDRLQYSWYLKYLEQKHWSFAKRVCVVKGNGEASLTPYGRLRASVCSGGWNKCSGEVKEYVSKDGDGTITEPLCDNCLANKNSNEIKQCAICDIEIRDGGNNPTPLLKEGRVCDMCDEVVIADRIKLKRGISNG